MTKVNIHSNTSTVIEDKSTGRQVLSGIKGGVVAAGLTGAGTLAAITAADFIPGVEGVASAITDSVGEAATNTSEYLADWVTNKAPIDIADIDTSTLTDDQKNFREATNAMLVSGTAAASAGVAVAAYKGGEKWTRKVKTQEVVGPSIG